MVHALELCLSLWTFSKTPFFICVMIDSHVIRKHLIMFVIGACGVGDLIFDENQLLTTIIFSALFSSRLFHLSANCKIKDFSYNSPCLVKLSCLVNLSCQVVLSTCLVNLPYQLALSCQVVLLSCLVPTEKLPNCQLKQLKKRQYRLSPDFKIC